MPDFPDAKHISDLVGALAARRATPPRVLPQRPFQQPRTVPGTRDPAQPERAPADVANEKAIRSTISI